MTNAQIIFNEAQRLAEAGAIKYTGREFVMETADGEQITVKETEDIHTFNGWKERGYRVQKGQKAVARFCIWKHSPGRVKELPNGEGEYMEKDRMFMKQSCFFSRSQVELINA